MSWRALLCPAILCIGSAAQAHILPKQNATMKVIDRSAYFVVSVPASALGGVHTDGSGRVSAAEIERNSPVIKRQFDARFHVSSEGGPAHSIFSMVMLPQADGTNDDSDYIVVLHRADFAAAPRSVTIATDLFGTRAGENQMTMSARRGVDHEIAVLQRGAGNHTYFRGGFSTFIQFIRVGFLHIWEGADHLLFLLTILIAGAGWRYWLAVITSFTLAHSVTLSLSALNVLRISPAIIEPGIAASIVVMALFNLGAPRLALLHRPWPRIAIVFACGLLHGFGFASALGALAVDFSIRIATLSGFNIGLELGQMLFVGSAVMLIAMLRRAPKDDWSGRLPQAASLVAAIWGSALLVQRMGVI